MTHRMRSEPRQDRSRATLERLLVAANDEFAAEGPSAASTAGIAARAGVSIGTVYRFFAGKDEIVAALVDRYRLEAHDRFGDELSDVTDRQELLDAFRRIVRIAGELQERHAGYYRITADHPPETDASPAHAVRSTLIDAFDQMARRVGATGDPARRRVVIELCIETVRHTLARAPAAGPERDLVVAELEALIVAYAADRLR